MTIIAAMHEAGVGTWIAGDTLVCADNETVGFTQKWTVRDGYAIATTGSNAVLSLVKEFDFSTPASPIEIYNQIVSCLKQRDFKPKADEGYSPCWDFSMLHATPERVVSVDCAGGVVPTFVGGFAARGSGATYAEGAAWAFAKSGLKPREIVEGSIAAAMAHCRGCGGEIWIDCLKAPQ